MQISVDISDPVLARLLEMEARRTGSTDGEILTRALEARFARIRRGSPLARLAEATFFEWDDPRDADYDYL